MIEVLVNVWLIPTLIGIGTGIFSFFITNHITSYRNNLKGKHLYSYEDFYPIANNNDEIKIDKKKLIKAINYFSKKRDKLAAFELFYLIDSCRLHFDFSEVEKNVFLRFKKKYKPSRLEKWRKEYIEKLDSYVEIVSALGDTFKKLAIEIVLHQAINPIQSIIALKNPTFGRELHDPNTNLGLDLIKDYGMLHDKSNKKSSEVGYEVNFNGQKGKGTSIPIYSSKYGLLGFICINIQKMMIFMKII